MKRFFQFILFLTSINSFSQTTNQIEFYKTGKFKSPKNLKMWLVKNSDTLKCEIVNEKINIPQNNGVYSVIIENQKERFVINDVDFSLLNSERKIIIGIEKNIENLKPVSKEYPNIYSILDSITFIRIENLNQAKEVVFVVFTSEETENKFKKAKSYTQYSLVKKE